MRAAIWALPLALAALVAPAPAAAAPGLGQKVYGATLDPGETEFELRYGRLTGGADNGEDALILEAAHHFSSRFYGAFLAEFEREPGASRKLEAIAGEAIFVLGRIAGIGVDTALYGEYEIGLDGPDKVETKLLLQKKAGAFDSRLNLIAEKRLQGDQPIGLGYAASADVEAVGELRLGAVAFGELGSTRRFTTKAEHFAGPVIKAEIEHLFGGGELEIEAGYLFAIGRARDDADGQLRLVLEFARRF